METIAMVGNYIFLGFVILACIGMFLVLIGLALNHFIGFYKKASKLEKIIVFTIYGSFAMK